MTRKKWKFAVGFLALTALSTACSTTVTLPEKPALPEVPEYVKVPHPAGFDLAHLKTIFFSPLAPKAVLGEFADTCDEDFKKLIVVTPAPQERKAGAAELVTNDPERMHWCFYAKISRLQDTLQGDTTWSTRQKRVLESFDFLSPIANAFIEVYHDARYLRWATAYYSKISEWVFFRKVIPSPESTLAEIQNARSELEPWVAVSNESKSDSVFAKYGISLAPTVASSGGNKVDMLNTDESSRAPASVAPTVVAEPEPVNAEKILKEEKPVQAPEAMMP